jgi:hypothetical protein
VFAIQLPLKISGASVRGRKLFSFGESFDKGALVLLNGEAQHTINDSESLAATVVAKPRGA